MLLLCYHSISVSLASGLWHVLSTVCKVVFGHEESGTEPEMMLHLSVGTVWLAISPQTGNVRINVWGGQNLRNCFHMFMPVWDSILVQIS